MRFYDETVYDTIMMPKTDSKENDQFLWSATIT